MEDRDRSRSPSRRTSKVEQVVGRWLRRSRESTSRERVLDDDGQGADASPQEHRSSLVKVSIQIPLDPDLKSHGFTLSTHTPSQVEEVITGGPADGKLLPGDQLVKVNDVAVDDLSTEQAVNILKECQDTITVTVLRLTVGPKSSFITPEKRAKLKSNPVKGNSLLFLPNVLKVYLENGQTKAFKFEHKTTVKDIVMTLKEKLSISRIEHFSLVLEQQYSIAKLFLLHEHELIQEVVRKRETHDYRCLFRVCFVPKYPQELLEDDAVAFDYLYLQSVSDVLQERFAVEMKCNTALRLAALHIQERLASTGQSPKTPLKTIVKDWGFESFVSNTLLRNMREKDLRKAISLHMKRILLQEHKHKAMTVNQARLSYLSEMSELKSFGGKSFSATMMLQDRESTVSLLVGAQYGVSQVINHKLSIMTTLAEFTSITRVELVTESERVSLVKIYMQDIKPMTLLLESAAAKDLSCLVAGYCKVCIDPQICVFPWTEESASHRISAEEGYVSRCCSDSEDSEVDALLGHETSPNQADRVVINQVVGQEEGKSKTVEEDDVEDKSEKESVENGAGKTKKEIEEPAESLHEDEGETVKCLAENDLIETKEGEQEAKEVELPCVVIVEDPPSEASDSVHTDSRFVTSMSSDSMDALEEDDFLTYFSTNCVSQLNVRDHYLHVDTHAPCPSQPDRQDGDFNDELCSIEFPVDDDEFLCLAALSNIAECLPSPTEASEDEYSEQGGDEDDQEAPEDVFESGEPLNGECVFTFNQGDAKRYYNICTIVTPDSGHIRARKSSSHHTHEEIKEYIERKTEPAPILLQPPPEFGDSSSEDEFFDAQERFIAEEPLSAPMPKGHSRESSVKKRTLSLSNVTVSAGEQRKRDTETRKRERKDKDKLKTEEKNEVSRFRKRSRKRRSFMETEYTSLVTFPAKDKATNYKQIPNHWLEPSHLGEDHPGGPSNQSPCPTVSCLSNAEGEPAQMESKPINLLHGSKISKACQRKQQVILMEPDSMEFKSVTEIMSTSSPAIVAVRTSTEPKVKVKEMSSADGLKKEGAVCGDMSARLLDGHLFFGTLSRDYADYALDVKINDQESLLEGPFNEPLLRKKSRSLPHLNQTSASSTLSLKVPATSFKQIPSMDRLDVENLEMDVQKCSTEPTMRARSQSMSAVCDSSAVSCLTKNLFPQTEPAVCTKEPHSGESSVDPFTQEHSSTVSVGWPTQGYVSGQCSGIFGQLSASTPQRKIQSLPSNLSRSQEVLASNSSLADYAKPARSLSEDISTTGVKSDKDTEVDEEFQNVVCNKSHVERVPKAEPEELSCPSKSPSRLKPDDAVRISPPSLVVTTQNIYGPWGVVTSQETIKLQAGNSRLVGAHSQPLTNCDCRPTDTQPQALSGPNLNPKPDFTCSSVLASVCETVIESAETPMEVCGCQSAYTNCFSGVLENASFDNELTVYEFSCRSQQSIRDRVALVTSIPPSSLSGSSSSFSPSSPLPAFSRVVPPPSLSTELGPLLSPLDTPDCFLSDPHGDAITALLSQHYPLPPTGFLALQTDVDTLLTVLDGAMKDHNCIQEHPRDTCAEHFSENKRRMHVEARGFLAGCQQVVKSGQAPAETLQALADSFHSLLQLTVVCLSFSSCQRCQERHTQTLLGLVDVAQTYQEFARAAERLGMATERRTCHELSIKLLARQCTALTTSVFCLTQLFRTLTAL
ncbi:FERM and PDZ domain-containing protein 1 isoform X2 [Tachysurus fulvidraco]|uniref:FERM and PDZ domain-containing protein 1 isoform X2 n=1 Tax=Tachysurus fulvidraco TaxID=1234273 RepID=UPI001FED8A96|nr:FERM and PDZ domain-containing protein 1 isoform X2 [Tachysurus fulvidraco]